MAGGGLGEGVGEEGERDGVQEEAWQGGGEVPVPGACAPCRGAEARIGREDVREKGGELGPEGCG